jgi:hypothetical protein
VPDYRDGRDKILCGAWPTWWYRAVSLPRQLRRITDGGSCVYAALRRGRAVARARLRRDNTGSRRRSRRRPKLSPCTAAACQRSRTAFRSSRSCNISHTMGTNVPIGQRRLLHSIASQRRAAWSGLASASVSPHNSIWIADVLSYAAVPASARRQCIRQFSQTTGNETRRAERPPGVTDIRRKTSASRSKLKIRNARIVVGARRRRVRRIHGAMIESSQRMVPSVSVVSMVPS